MAYSLRSLRIRLLCVSILLNVVWMVALYLHFDAQIRQPMGMSECEYFKKLDTLWIIAALILPAGIAIPSEPLPQWLFLIAGAMIPLMLLQSLIVLITWDCSGWGFAVVG